MAILQNDGQMAVPAWNAPKSITKSIAIIQRLRRERVKALSVGENRIAKNIGNGNGAIEKASVLHVYARRYRQPNIG
jgi:hypothetical protein